MAVQTGGVGMIRLGMAGDVLIGGADDEEQAERIKERKRKERSLCI
jgi:hypothetical protein